MQVEIKDIETIDELTSAVEEESSLGCGGNCSLCSVQCSHSTIAASETSATIEGNIDWSNLKHCPECGSKIQHEGGCMICMNCGFSKCG
ncbi:hypothetical protein SDC9_140270 [bioreactor metagenome]